MQNVEMRIEKNKLIIEVDLSKTFGPSKSGKTVIVASTAGNSGVPGPNKEQIKVGLNVFKPNPERAKE